MMTDSQPPSQAGCTTENAEDTEKKDKVGRLELEHMYDRFGSVSPSSLAMPFSVSSVVNYC